MRESRTYGSVRGPRGNSRPYRVKPKFERAIEPAVAEVYLQHVPAAVNRDSQDTPEVRV
jgi:hypothetical protein